MASGLLGKASPAANTWTPVYTVPATKVTTMNIRLVNRDVNTSTNIRLAISTVAGSGAPADSEYIEPVDYPMLAGEVLEDIALVAGPGEIVKIYASSGSVSIRVMGFEANQS